MSPRLNARRRVAVALVVLAAAFVPPAATATAQVGPIDSACPGDGRVPGSGFTDLGPAHAQAIACIAAYGVAAGRTPTAFAPLGDVTRGQMTTFLLRSLDIAGVALPEPVAETAFPDVAGSAHADSIRVLSAFDPPIVSGFADGTFRPTTPVTRGQTATLLAAAHAVVGGPDLPHPGGTGLTDVAGTTHADAIVALEAAGVVTGFADGTYRPTADVGRGQMASLIARHLGLWVDAGVIGGLAPGEWVVLPESPMSPYHFLHAAVWADHRLRAWGGVAGLDAVTDAGVVYDPIAGAWNLVPEAPVAARHSPVAAWTGEQVLVWGGVPGLGDTMCLGDGAAYDPATGVWQVLPSSPLTPRCPAAAWTGDEWVLWGGAAGEGIPPKPLGDGAAYDPAAQDWRTIADAPIARAGAGAVWTGEEVVVFGGVDAGGDPRMDGAAYHPGDDAWRAVAEAPLTARSNEAVTWTGDELLVVGGVDATLPEGEEAPAAAMALSDGARYDPASDGWEPLTRNLPGRHISPEAAWGDGLAYVVGGDPDAPGPVAAAFDPVDGTWSVLASPPGGGRINHTATWGEDGRLYVYGGSIFGAADPPGAIVWDPF